MTSATRHWIGLALLAQLAQCGACARQSSRDYYTFYRDAPSDLHQIETMVLRDLSKSPPQPLDEAVAELGDPEAMAQEPAGTIELDLDAVRAAALLNNLDLRVEVVNPAVAREAIREAEAFFEPLLTMEARQERINRQVALAPGSEVNTRSTSLGIGVLVPLRSGGSVNVNLFLNKSDDDTFEPTKETRRAGIVNPSYESALRFSISQPLLRNAGVHTNTHLIRIAKYNRDIVDARTRLAVINILAEADRAYWLLYASRGELDVRRQQHQRAIEQLEQARLRVAAGASPQIEIMRAEAGVANRLEAIIVADTLLRRSERDLKRIMNRSDLDLDSPTSITTLTEPDPVGLVLDANELTKRAIKNRMELLEIELQLAIDASRVDFEKNGLLPRLDLEYGVTLNGFGGSFSDTRRRSGSGDFADYSIGLVAEIPIGNAAARARVRRARWQRRRRLATLEQRRLTIRQEVYDALDQLEQAWQRILAARQEVVLAGRTYLAEQRQFEVGARTSVEVLEAANSLASAQSREVRALAAYEIARVEIALATGSLLGAGGVLWQAR